MNADFQDFRYKITRYIYFMRSVLLKQYVVAELALHGFFLREPAQICVLNIQLQDALGILPEDLL